MVQKIASMRAVGHSQEFIANEVGVNVSTVSRALAKRGTREILQSETSRLLKALPSMVELVIARSALAIQAHAWLKSKGSDIPDPLPRLDPDDMRSRMDYIKECNASVSRAMGILGLSSSPAPSAIFNTLVNLQGVSGLDAVVAQAIGSSMQSLLIGPPTSDSDPDIEDVIDIT